MGKGHGGKEERNGGPSISISFGTAAIAGNVVIGDGKPRANVVVGGGKGPSSAYTGLYAIWTDPRIQRSIARL